MLTCTLPTSENRRGDLELSIGELRSGLEMMPNNPDLHLRVADSSLKLEKLDDAIKEYNTVLGNTPGNSAAAKGLTSAYYLKANKEAGGAFLRLQRIRKRPGA